MIKSHKPFPRARPSSRLDNAIHQNKLKYSNPARFYVELQGNLLKKQKSHKSPSKENNPAQVNANRKKAIAQEKLQLPLIKVRKVMSQDQRNLGNQANSDFQSYCAKGHAVYVDERDAGVKLGHLVETADDRERKLAEHKNLLGETAYVPFNIEFLKRKVEQKLNTTASTTFEQTH